MPGRYGRGHRPRRQERENRPARAPYNFIPIKDKAVIGGNPFLKNKYNETLYTGYIDLEIKTLTPVYIRDGLPLNEYNNDHRNNTDFFNINGKYLIPGSSLKGMIRTLVEIVTFSKFKFYDDKRLYYRLVAAKTDLRTGQQYKSKLLDHTERHGNSWISISKAKPGFLYKEGKDYYIIPAKKSKYNLEHGAKGHGCNEEPGFVRKGNTYYVCSGAMNRKHHHYSFTLPNPIDRKILLSDEDINDYKNDITRNSKLDLLKSLKKHKFVPCFYIRYNNRYAFGHNPFFRLPYAHTISNFVPKPDTPITDISESMFGIENDKDNSAFSGKVFFESSVLEGNPQFAINQPARPDVLSSPKPTSFQLYLEQPANNLNRLISYNDTGFIRGYKMYWHKNNPDWQPRRDLNQNILATPIKPLSQNNVFKGKIRFENLHSYELGALLFILDLPQGMAHKIGLGKPLGLGSIRITPTLHLSNRQDRYSNLWTEFAAISESDKTEFIDKFRKFVLDQLQQLNINVADIWQQDRFRQLKKMLNFDQNIQIQNWFDRTPRDKTSYMELGEFKSRAVLPKSTDVR